MKKKPLRYLTTPSLDFLLLGGLSLLVWSVMVCMRLFQTQSEVEPQLFDIMIAFSWLSIVCNYPHFLISYRFGYGRGKAFVFKHWPSLIAVPVAVIGLYIFAFFYFNDEINNSVFVQLVNSFFYHVGISFKVGVIPNLGVELLSIAIRIMYLTTGWHYAKQAFGCIMVFSHYHDYPISKLQRLIWKLSLFSVAIYNFIFINNYSALNGGTFLMFFNAPMSKIIFPEVLESISLYLVLLSGLFVFYFILYKNYKSGKFPTSSILIPWIALHFWWIPLFGMMDFYFLAVPFFHGLQYLLFAYQMEAPDKSLDKVKRIQIMSLKIFVLFALGYLTFELGPRFLDIFFETGLRFNVMFFLVAITVFINIHHFFIDSVVWRFNDETIRKKLLD